MKKKSFLYLLCTVATLFGWAQGSLPKFTTAGNDTAWYYVQFKTGSNCLKDVGTNGANLITATKSDTKNLKWALVGTKDNFKLVSQLGNEVTYSNSKFCSSSNKNGISFRLVNGSDCWELQRTATTTACMNQWQGTSVGVTLGEWTTGDTNNGLNFFPAAASLPTFSDQEETWYFLQFLNKHNTILDQGSGTEAILSTADPIDGQLWKLVGTKDNFQLVSKLGNYAYISGSGSKARLCTRKDTIYDGGFSLRETTNFVHAPAWEIHDNNVSVSNSNLNQWTGPTVGNPIGLWSLGSVNNPITFLSPSDMVYDDYKVSPISSYSPEHKLTLWYDMPATLTGVENKWMEYSLPIGNGQLGASLFGGVAEDEIQFNEKTLWTGTPNDMGSYGQYKNFGSILVKNLSGDFNYSSQHPATDYVRYLDIETATAGVDFSNHDATTTYQRRYIASAPDRVIAVHYTANGDSLLNLRFSFTPGQDIAASTPSYSNSEGSFSGQLATVKYNATFRVIGGEGAIINASELGVQVYNTSEITLLLSALTDYNTETASCNGAYADVGAESKNRLDAAAQKGWTQLYEDHKSFFTNYMSRVSLQLGEAASSVPTNKLVDNYNNGNKNITGTEPETLFLEQLYFVYGRYLEISSSMGIDVPNNLQGIWNNKSSAPWNSDIHSNINIQMNYWPAEPTNLSEAHLPFLNYIIRMAQRNNWKRAATTYGGVTKGWTCFTENNIFGGMSTWGNNYFVANVWYCSHLWQHYLYTLDKDFLKRAFPVMYSAAQFWMQRMIKDRGYSALGIASDGTFVAPNEYSPEQDAHKIEDGTAHAQQLIFHHLKSVREAIDILAGESGVTTQEIEALDNYISNTDQGLHTETYTANTTANSAWTNPRNGVAKGATILREWKYSTYDVSDDPNHRHMSHLMALYPLNAISSSSPYFVPAVNSLKLRGDAATGWSMGWKVNLWARAHDGNHAHTILHNALKHSSAYTTNQYAGGVYYNLYDSHAPFQIDGNFGVCAGIAEMLMQSHTKEIQILPALPSVWASGEVTGLKAVGDFEVSIKWSSGKADVITITSNKGSALTVSYPGIYDRLVTVDGEEIDCTPQSLDIIDIPLAVGQTAVINLDNQATSVNSIKTKKDNISITTKGTTIIIDGCLDIKQVIATDTLGHKLASSNNGIVNLPEQPTRVVMLSIIDSNDNTFIKKIRM